MKLLTDDVVKRITNGHCSFFAQMASQIGVLRWRQLIDLNLNDPQFIAHWQLLWNHQPLPEPDPHAPFKTKRDWLEFTQSMAKLRDPSIDMIGREHLLKIGETIEARQRPHAERMGWLTEHP